MRDSVLVYINGKKFELTKDLVFLSLSDFLRYELGMTGTKVVCAEGDCGACTVLQGSIWDKGKNGRLNYRPINSCITFMYLLDASHLITIEGIAEENELHPVQKAMVECHGAQCGFCTPGFICSMTGFFDERLNQKKNIDEKKIQNALTGNLCRCTGYDSILKAGLSVDTSKIKLMSERYHSESMLQDLERAKNTEALIVSENKEVFIAGKLKQALEWRSQNKTGRIVSGSSDLGVLINKHKFTPHKLLQINHIESLHQMSNDGNKLIIGARVTLNELGQFCEQTHPEFARLIHIFASPQIKNIGTLVGNVANGSPIGDTLPALFVLEAEVEIQSLSGKRLVNINSFYQGYRQLDLRDDEIITAIHIPLMKKEQELKLFKISKRKDMDISAVTLAASFFRQQGKILSIKLAMGGVGPVIIRPKKTEDFLKGKDWSLHSFEVAGASLTSEITPQSDVRGSKEYRNLISKNLLLKIYYDSLELEQEVSL